MREIKNVQLIDNLQQLATDILEYILDEDNQQIILKFLTGVDILSINNKISSIAVLKLITEYFSTYAWDINSVNMLVLCELIKRLPQPHYHDLIIEKENLNPEVMRRLKDLFLMKATNTLHNYQPYTSQKLKQALIDSFLRKKFQIDEEQRH